jgi:hypothetical protein
MLFYWRVSVLTVPLHESSTWKIKDHGHELFFQSKNMTLMFFKIFTAFSLLSLQLYFIRYLSEKLSTAFYLYFSITHPFVAHNLKFINSCFISCYFSNVIFFFTVFGIEFSFAEFSLYGK